MFGEEDLISNEKRNYSVKCISPRGIVRIINKKNFLQRVLIDKTTQVLIEKIKEKKEKWFSEKIEETRKIFQSNKNILTQNMTKDFILNNFLKNQQKTKVVEKTIPEKMKLTQNFLRKGHYYSHSLDALNYSDEKENEEFLKLKTEFEQKQFGKDPSKKKLYS